MSDWDLESLASLKGFLGALVCDDLGGVVASTNNGPQNGPEAAVLAQAAHSACDALGFRMGLGGCHEICQRHAHGGIRIRCVSSRHYLVIWHGDQTSAADLEAVLSQWPSSGTTLGLQRPEGGETAKPSLSTAEWDPFGPTPSPSTESEVYKPN